MRFVLDSLSRSALHPRCNRTSGTPAVTVALGHSLGGAAALTAASEGTRLQGVINMDGSVYGDVLDMCLTNPVLFFGHEGKNLTTDETWEAMWPRLNGWKELLMLDGSQHYRFSDLPALAASLGLDVSDSEALTGMLGTTKGTMALNIITGAFDSFVQFVVGKKEANGFDAVLREYPEVQLA